MENGVSGCRVRRPCRNDNEDHALGERTTGRTSSSAHGDEPIVWVAKAPHRNGKRAAIGATSPYHNRKYDPRAIGPTATVHKKNGTRSLLSTERCRSECDYKRFLARPVREPPPSPLQRA
jgi:hypothetical protein